MRVLLQRVRDAKVKVAGRITGEIGGLGLLLYAAVHNADTLENIDKLAEKVVNLRVFENGKGKFHYSALDINAPILIVPQFTLYADVQKGRRPSFFESAEPSKAREYFEKFIDKIKSYGLHTAAGVFGANMDVSYTNAGPVSIIIDR